MTSARRLRFLAAVAAPAAFAAALALPAAAQVAIQINGTEINVSPSPMIQDGRVFVPLRGVFQDLGANVNYSNGQITASGNGRDISLQIGSRQAMVDNQPQTIDVAPFIIGASTFVPLRFVSQALGANVAWDDNDRLVSIRLNGAPEAVSLQVPESDGDWVDAPPPPLPAYSLPPMPQPGDVWIPGYWAWGEAGYYWVPGLWSQPPQSGWLWTPGYWSYNTNASYVWHQGYWGASVGFYGGINYGAGYSGHGYARGATGAVEKRPSFNGGPGGVSARPTAPELAAARAPHHPPTQQQTQHAQVAAQDRRGLATVNAGKPPVVAAPRAFTPASKPAGTVPVTSTDRAAGQKLAPQTSPHTFVHHAPAVPVAAAPVGRAGPVVRPAAPAPARPAPARPAPARPAPAQEQGMQIPHPAAPAAPRVAQPAEPRRPEVEPVRPRPAATG